MNRHERTKKIVTALLALTLLLTCALPALAAEPGFVNFQNKVAEYSAGLFPDVGEVWYAEYVAAVYELGLMRGGTDGAFHPDDGVTLAESVALAARIHQTYYTGSADFTQGSPWYQVYVDYCRDKGILTADFPDYTAPAKRREFALLLSRTLPEGALQEINTVAPGDIPDVPWGSAGSTGIYRLYRAGVLTGNDAYGTFAPDSEIRRSEVAAIVSRMAYRSLRQQKTLQPKPAWPDLTACERRENEEFKDAAMLGNSLVDGMHLFSGLSSSMDFYGETGSTVYKNRLSELLLRQYGRVYIEFGINELGGIQENFIKRYRDIISQIRSAMPDAEIYVMSVTPVTKTVSNKGIFTMQKINAVNDALYALAGEMECWYLDCCTPLCTAEGYLLDRYAGWDGSPHLDTSGYVAWEEVIRTHCVPAEAE